MSAERRRRGRHVKPPGYSSARRFLGSRVTIALVSGGAGVLAVSLFTLAGGPPAKKEAASTGSASRVRPAAPHAATASPRADLDRESDEDLDAVDYFKEKDTDGKVVEHVDEVRWSGRYVRVYTDLDEGDTRSEVALDLCKWTSEYLTDRQGARNPVVFVHAKRSGNGNVVLVSKLGADDACKSVETR